MSEHEKEMIGDADYIYDEEEEEEEYEEEEDSGDVQVNKLICLLSSNLY